MRLLRVDENGEFTLAEDLTNSALPRPFFRTHGDGHMTENLKDLDCPRKTKSGCRKLRFCARQAERDGLQYWRLAAFKMIRPELDAAGS